MLLFSHLIMSDSLRPHRLQHARLACPSLTPRVCSNSCPLSQWWHPTISSCCPLLFLPSVFLSIRVFYSKSALCIRWPNIKTSASASVLPMNIQGWFPLGLTGLLSLLSKWLSRVFSITTAQNHQFFGAQSSFMVQLSHLYMATGKTIALTVWTFVGKVMFLLFNTLSKFLKFFFQGASVF